MAIQREQYDVFVMHSRADTEWVETYLANVLRDAGISFELQSRLPEGTPVAVAIEEAIASSHRQVLVVSHGTVADSLNDLVVALTSHQELAAGMWSLIPLVLDREAFDDVRTLVQMRNPVDLTDDWEVGLERLVAAFGKELPQPGPAPKHRYLGLTSFKPEDRDVFFGRDNDIRRLVRRVATRSVNIVTGPSGIGKSSLVRAGVIPRIGELDPNPGERRWECRVVMPGADPVGELIAALDGELDDTASGASRASRALDRMLTADVDELLLFVDQVEAVLTDRAAAAVFVDTLLSLLDNEHVHLVIAVRDEYRDDLHATALGPRAEKSEFRLAPLDRDGLRAAITGPARDVGVVIAGELVERIVAEAAGEPGILPFVQVTLIALWPEVRRGYLPYEAYDQLVADTAGPDRATGLAAALANHADDVLARLDADRDLVESVLIRLVQFGEGRPNVRRRQTLARLTAGSARYRTGSPGLIRDLAGHDNRLLTIGYPTQADDGDGAIHDDERVTVALAHDSLLSGWPFLVAAVSDEANVAAEVVRRRVESDAQQYRDGDRSYLWTGRRLRDSRRWRREHPDDVSAVVADFLRASWRWYLGSRLVVAGLALIVLLVGASYLDSVLDEGAALALARGDDLLVPVGAVWLERYEVTNERYAACVREGPCEEPGFTRSGKTYDDPDRANFPVLAVTAFDAAMFCEWIDRELPRWSDWLHAATGGGSRSWPWPGDDIPSPVNVNVYFVEDMPEPAVDLTPELEDTIDGLIENEDMTTDLLSEHAPWVPERERENVVLDWPSMSIDQRAERLLQFLSGGTGDDTSELDVLAVDTMPEGATPDDPRIHHLVGNAGEWTSSVSGCEGTSDECVWDGTSDVRLLTASSFAGDANALFEPLAGSVGGARDHRGFRCAEPRET